ncbi:phage portal protein [Pediococcus acidilactici]|uniref:phage portal protein n=1 Tax=Pediococcus acidilactici TaxID=1254 RepID=UPI0023304416|nr:phage portal protein [Pediococcus acidilactici]MDB8867673.1 phage portal protein [Pediococcus acidilactici]
MPIFKRSPISNSLRGNDTSFSISDDESIINFLNPQGSHYISADVALRNSDIYSIIFQISGDLASSKLFADGQRAQGILDNPADTTNQHAFWQAMYAQLLLGGEAFAYRWRNINGTDLKWEYLRPSQVSTFLLDDGSGLIYTVSFDEPEFGVKQAVPASDMIHIRLLSKNGGKTGISPLSALSSELDIKKSSNKLTLNALAQSIISPGVLSIKKGGLLSASQKSARSKQFVNQVRSSNNGPIVLDHLEEYTPLEIKSNVAQLLSQTDWTSKQIAKVFGIPDSYVNGQGDQQSSVDQIKGMYANALNRYMNSVVSELNNKLNANVYADIRPAIDPLGDNYANNLSNITKSGTIAPNQALWMLQQVGYFPEDMPEAKASAKPKATPKGGDEDDQEDND